MLFAILALLKAGAEDELIKYSDGLNEQVGANSQNVSLAGALRGEGRRKKGYLAFLEVDSIAEAREWVESSPIFKAHLYERLEVLEYDVEVGRLGGRWG